MNSSTCYIALCALMMTSPFLYGSTVAPQPENPNKSTKLHKLANDCYPYGATTTIENTLIDNGHPIPNPHALDENGKTAIEIAQSRHCHDLVKIFKLIESTYDSATIETYKQSHACHCNKTACKKQY